MSERKPGRANNPTVGDAGAVCGNCANASPTPGGARVVCRAPVPMAYERMHKEMLAETDATYCLAYEEADDG